jgi:hypothetical protein
MGILTNQQRCEPVAPAELGGTSTRLPRFPDGYSEAAAWEIQKWQTDIGNQTLGKNIHYEMIGLQEEITSAKRFQPLKRFMAFGGRWALRAAFTGIGSILAMDATAAFWPTKTVLQMSSSEKSSDTQAKLDTVEIEAATVFDIHGHAAANISAGSAWYDASSGPLGMRFRVTKIDEKTGTFVKNSLKDKDFDPETIKEQAGAGLDHLQLIAHLKGGGMSLLGGAFGAGVGELILAYARNRRFHHAGKELPQLRSDLFRIAAAGVILPTSFLSTAAGMTIATLRPFQYEKLHYDGSIPEVAKLLNATFSSVDKYKTSSAQLSVWFDNLAIILKNLNALPNVPKNLIPILAIGDRHSRPCSYHTEEALIQGFDPAFVDNGGDDTEWGQIWESPLFSTADCPNDNPSILTKQELMRPGNHDKYNIAALQQYAQEEAFDQPKTIHVTTQGPSGPIEFSISSAPDRTFTPDVADRPALAEEDRMIKEQGNAIGELARAEQASNPGAIKIVAGHNPAAVDQARRVLGEELTNYFFIDNHTHQFAIIKDGNDQIIGVNPSSFGGSGARSFEQGTDQERSTSEAAVIFVDPINAKIFSVLQLAVQNDGNITSEMHYSGQPVNANKAERLDTLFSDGQPERLQVHPRAH